MLGIDIIKHRSYYLQFNKPDYSMEPDPENFSYIGQRPGIFGQ